VVFDDKPFLRFERFLETSLAFAPQGFSSFQQAMLIWIKESLLQKKMLIDALQELDPNFDCGEIYSLPSITKAMQLGLTF
jgi:carbamoyltransferase